MRCGSRAMRITVSLVSYGTSSRPSIGGTTGRLPTARTRWSAVTSSSLPSVSETTIDRAPVSRARPSSVVTFGRPSR